MLLDVQLDARPDLAADRAREARRGRRRRSAATFEGPHDVFLPLAAAAGVVETDLMTNVAIAMPRSPMHLAHTAWDLQLMSKGRFRLGLGSQIRPHIEKRYGATWSPPAARMREIVAPSRRSSALAARHAARLPRRAHPAHPDAADVRPRPEPVRRPAGAARRARTGDDPDRRGGGRRAAGDALPQPAPLRRAHAAGRPGGTGRAGRRVDRHLPAGDRRDGPHVGRASRRPRSASGGLLGVLRLDPGVPPGPRRRGLGRRSSPS